MRDRDRWWWLLVLAGIACGIAAVVVPYQFMTTAPTPAENQFVTNDEYRQWIVLFVVFGVAFFVFGVIFITMAARARRRHRLRVAAFSGDVSALPLANIRTEPAAAPDVATQPLELMWRRSQTTGATYILGGGLAVAVGILSVVGVIYALLTPIFALSQPLPNGLIEPTPQPLSGLELVFRFAGATVAVATVVAVVILLIRLLPFLLGLSFGVIATDQGLDAQTEFGTRIHIGWEEAVVLEAMGTDASAVDRYSLYALGKCISWAAYRTRFGAVCVPVDISASEMMLRQAALLNLVVARTELPPQTFVKSLQHQPTSSRDSTRLISVIFLLVCALLLAGIVVIESLVPFVSMSWLKWVSTGMLALAVLCAVFSALRVIFTRSAVGAPSSPPTAAAPTFDAPSLAYSLSWRTPQSRRVRMIVLGLLLAINVIPAVLLFLVAVGVPLPGVQPKFPSGDNGDLTFMGRYGMALVHGFITFIGVAIVYGSTIASTGRMQADQHGLTTIFRRQQQTIAWSNIQDIMWGAWGEDHRYWVTSNVMTIGASWPAASQSANVIPPDGGALPIGADELAALVAAQIGKPVRVREGR